MNEKSTSDKITFNETFFNDKSNSNLNPLSSSDSPQNHITYYKKTLYDSIVNEENQNDSSKSLVSSTSGNSAICRDGFVTNHRYQMLKDNKRSESQRTTCYDEVIAAKEEENEDSNEDFVDEDDEEDLASKRQIPLDMLSCSSGASSTSSTSELKYNREEAKAVVIHMYDEEHDVAEGKQKFESLIQRKELENRNQSLNLNDDLQDIISATAVSDTSNLTKAYLYEQQDNLLKKYENEVKSGKTAESMEKAKQIFKKLEHMSSANDRYSSILNSRNDFGNDC